MSEEKGGSKDGGKLREKEKNDGVEEAKGAEMIKPSGSRNLWREKNMNGDPSFKPSFLKEHPVKVKKPPEDQLNIPSRNLVVLSLESNQSNNFINEENDMLRKSIEQLVPPNNYRSPRMSDAFLDKGSCLPQQPLKDDPHVIGQGTYRGSIKQSGDKKQASHKIDNLFKNVKRSDSDGLQSQAKKATTYPHGQQLEQLQDPPQAKSSSSSLHKNRLIVQISVEQQREQKEETKKQKHVKEQQDATKTTNKTAFDQQQTQEEDKHQLGREKLKRDIDEKAKKE